MTEYKEIIEKIREKICNRIPNLNKKSPVSKCRSKLFLFAEETRKYITKLCVDILNDFTKYADLFLIIDYVTHDKECGIDDGYRYKKKEIEEILLNPKTYQRIMKDL